MTETPTLYPTKTRRDLLRAVDHRRVFTANGIVMRRTDGGMNRRCDTAIRELKAAGWVLLAGNGTYELTGAGRDVLDGPR
jgi:hypothetical protein